MYPFFYLLLGASNNAHLLQLHFENDKYETHRHWRKESHHSHFIYCFKGVQLHPKEKQGSTLWIQQR